MLSGLLSAQISFTNRNDLLAFPGSRSGVALGVADVDGDGLDDIVRLNLARHLAIEYQTGPNQPFSGVAVGTILNSSAWGMCVADVDNNGYADILSGGAYNGIFVTMVNGQEPLFQTGTPTNTPQTFVQAVNFADIDNDGWLDAFVCHDDGFSRIFMNDGAGHLVFTPSVIDFTTVPNSDGSGNYGSVWTDVNNDGHLDLYVAKCRQGVTNPNDARRINALYLNNGDGTYSQDTLNLSGLRIGAQSWTADFGDIDNDGDLDCFITNHDQTSQVLENDGNGVFTDITASSGLLNAVQGLPIQGVFADFDNDGFMDILVSGTRHYIFRNNGNKTFTAIPNPFNSNFMESFAIGDLNGDGFADIYGGYADIYTTPSNIDDVLWMNNGNDNNWFGMNLRGVQSNRSGVGARITVHSALGTQVRDVRAGESYGISNSLQMRFGLGQVTQIDSVIVRWPSGTIDRLYTPSANQYVTLEEGGCLVPQVNLAAAGSTTFCTGESVAITAPEGFSTYLWNTGETTQAITASEAGNYRVTVTTAEGCSTASSVITTTVNPVEIPQLVALGDTTFCQGGGVQLSSTTAAAYTWSNGETTQTITATESGSYTVSAQGLCEVFTSAPILITVLEALAPQAEPVSVPLGEPVVFTATGTDLYWYDAATGGNLLATGPTYELGPIEQSTSVWVENHELYAAPNEYAGPENHAGNNLSGNQFLGQVIFDAYTSFTLKSVKVYTDVAGLRDILLTTSTGEIIHSRLVDIPVGTSVIPINFEVEPGTELILTTNVSTNQANLGTISPQLYRSSQGVQYPYTLPGVLSITGSNLGNDRYYYFYNWELEFPSWECISERVEVVADILVSTRNTAAGETLNIAPNPATGLVNIRTTQLTGAAQLIIRSTDGRVVQTAQVTIPDTHAPVTADLSQLPQGAYLIELHSGQQIARGRVVKQ